MILGFDPEEFKGAMKESIALAFSEQMVKPPLA